MDKTAISSLPVWDASSKTYFTKKQCQQVLACTKEEFARLERALSSVGTSPIFDGKALFSENIMTFDPSGVHRGHLWAEVERSNELFAELLSGTRQNCDAKTWLDYLQKVKRSILHNKKRQLKRQSEKDPSDGSELPNVIQSTESDSGQATRKPRKRKRTSEVIDLDDNTRDDEEQMTEAGDSSGSGVFTDWRKLPVPLARRPDLPSTTSPIPYSSPRRTPLRGSVLAEAVSDEIMNEDGTFFNPSLRADDYPAQHRIDGIGDHVQQLIDRHLEQRLAKLESDIETRVASEIAAERAQLASEQDKLTDDRAWLNLTNELAQADIAEERSQLDRDSTMLKEAAAEVAAERTELDALIEQQVQIRLEAEKARWTEDIAKKLRSLF